jgi:hypothetical protein
MIQSDLWDVQPGANLKNIQRTSFESDQPLTETPTESRILQINQEKFCLAFVCTNDSDWTSMHQLINVHGFLYPTRRQSNQQSNENLLNAGSEYLKEHFSKISNFNSRKTASQTVKWITTLFEIQIFHIISPIGEKFFSQMK